MYLNYFNTNIQEETSVTIYFGVRDHCPVQFTVHGCNRTITWIVCIFVSQMSVIQFLKQWQNGKNY